MALKRKFYWKLFNNQQGIPYKAGPKQEGMPFSAMIKVKLKFFKSIQNKITKKYQFYFSFILKYLFLNKKDYMTQEERKRWKKKKEKIKEI